MPRGRLRSVRVGSRPVPGDQPGRGVGLRGPIPEAGTGACGQVAGGRCGLRGRLCPAAAPPGGPKLLGATSRRCGSRPYPQRPLWAAGGTSPLTTRSARSRLPRRAPPGVPRHPGPVSPCACDVPAAGQSGASGGSVASPAAPAPLRGLSGAERRRRQEPQGSSAGAGYSPGPATASPPSTPGGACQRAACRVGGLPRPEGLSPGLDVRLDLLGTVPCDGRGW